jgi:histidinol-phosphatase
MSGYQTRLEFAINVAAEASELILPYYQSVDLAVELKRDQSPVTVADKNAEQLIRDRLTEEFPDDGVLGEEHDDKESKNGYRWILDPIDGTKSFVHGVPLFGTLIGVEKDDEMVIGVCRFPALNEVVYAANGSGTWWQRGDDEPEQVHVTSVDALSNALFCITTITGWAKIGRQDVFQKLVSSARLTRGWGDCYGHILVATGRADVMVDPEMNPWDIAALIPILHEAGGHFFGWDGTTSVDSGNGVSVNAALRAQVLELLK